MATFLEIRKKWLAEKETIGGDATDTKGRECDVASRSIESVVETTVVETLPRSEANSASDPLNPTWCDNTHTTDSDRSLVDKGNATPAVASTIASILDLDLDLDHDSGRGGDNVTTSDSGHRDASLLPHGSGSRSRADRLQSPAISTRTPLKSSGSDRAKFAARQLRTRLDRKSVAPLPPAGPCQVLDSELEFCGSVLFWLDGYGVTRCWQCSAPPFLAAVKVRLRVIVVLAPDVLAWEDPQAPGAPLPGTVRCAGVVGVSEISGFSAGFSDVCGGSDSSGGGGSGHADDNKLSDDGRYFGTDSWLSVKMTGGREALVPATEIGRTFNSLEDAAVNPWDRDTERAEWLQRAIDRQRAIFGHAPADRYWLETPTTPAIEK